MKRVHDILSTSVLFSRIIHLTHACGEPDYMVNLWRCSEELEKRGGQDKRRCRDCNENAIICSWTDIILLWNYGRYGDSKAAFSRLSIWIWLTTDSRRAIPLKYWVWIMTRLPLKSLYWSPPVQLTYLEEMQPGDVQRKQLNRRKATTYEEQFPPCLRLVTHYTVN